MSSTTGASHTDGNPESYNLLPSWAWITVPSPSPPTLDILFRGEAPGPIRQGRDAGLPSFPAFYDHGSQLTLPVLSLYIRQYIRALPRVSNNKWNSQSYGNDRDILRLSENRFLVNSLSLIEDFPAGREFFC